MNAFLVGKKAIPMFMMTILILTTFTSLVTADISSGTDWPMVRHDSQATTTTTAEASSKHDLLWGREIIFEFEETLVIDQEVYTSDALGTIYSLNLTTGETRWRYDAPFWGHSEIFHHFFVGDQCVYMMYNLTDLTHNFTLQLMAVHRSDGSQCFQVTFPRNEWIGGPIMNDRGILLVNATTLWIYDKHTGAVLDTQNLGTRVTDLYQASDKDLIFFKDKDLKVHAYDLTKKATIWTTTDELLTGWPYPLIVAGNKVLIESNWRNLTALDKTTGNKLWSDGQVDTLELAANDKYVVATTYSDIRVFDITTGSQVWGTSKNLTDYSMVSPPTIANDQVLATISDKLGNGSNMVGYTDLSSFDLKTGKVLWTYNTSNRSVNLNPPIVVPNEIIFVNSKGIYALGDRSKVGILHQSLVKDTSIFKNGNISTDTGKNLQFQTPPISGISQTGASYHWNFGDGATSNQKDISHRYKKSGTYAATLTIKQGGRIIILQNSVSVRPVASVKSPFPYGILVSIILIGVVVGIVGVGSTEPGKYWMLPFFFLLYTRIKKVEALDHYQRGRIMGYLQANPGEHYNSIREELGIQNGVLAYHLSVLEREGYIRSRRDRFFKRFYPSGTKVPEPISVEEQIIGAIRRNPGITQIEIADRTGLPPSTINRVLHQQQQAGAVILVRDGRLVRCHLMKEAAQ